jgi:hypothetical protein
LARRISGLRGVLKSSACMSFSAICNLSRLYQFIHLNIKASIIQAGTRNKRGRLRGKKIRACPPRRPSSINRLELRHRRDYSLCESSACRASDFTAFDMNPRFLAVLRRG